MKAMPALAAALLVGAAFADEELKSRTLLDGQVTMLVPASFTVMSDADRRLKYPGTNRPAQVLTDATTTVNIALGVQQMEMKPGDLENFLAAARHNLPERPGVTIHSSGIRTINGRDFMVIVMDTTNTDGVVQNVMAMTPFAGHALLVSYNCMPSRDAGCGALGNRLIESIEVSEK